jgi:hypothetical protein
MGKAECGDAVLRLSLPSRLNPFAALAKLTFWLPID